MGVAKKCQTIRPQCRNSLDRRQDTLLRLIRQAVHQIEVQTTDPRLAKALCGVRHDGEGLVPIDRKLNFRIKILYSDARPRCSQSGKSLDDFFLQTPGIHFYGNLGIGQRTKVPPKRLLDSCDFFGRQEAGGAATKVKVGKRTGRAAKGMGQKFYLSQQQVDIGHHRPHVPHYLHVAATEPAKAVAEGDVKIE